MSMCASDLPTVESDVVVIGAGGAACRAALSAAQAGARVRLLAKAPLRQGGSSVHGASEIMGINAAARLGDENDSPAVHYEDTMRLARGFVDAALVEVLAEDAPQRVRELIDMGTPFDRNGNRFNLLKSDFNSYGRALTAMGRTGRAIVTTLTEAMLAAGVQVDAPAMLVDLVRDAEGRAAGVLAWDLARHRFVLHRARAVVFGTGGAHGIFSQQVSTAEMTGDGQAVAFRHGAELVNLEFHQFGPAMVHPYVQLFSKSVFALRPRLFNAADEEFLPHYLPEGVTIDAVMEEKVFPFTTSNVSRYLDIAMAREVAAGRGTDRGAVWFSFTHCPPEAIAARVPNTRRWMEEHGLDLRRDRLEVGTAFQCMNGGVRMTGANAESTIPGLFVCGEVAGGVRGPDRPGGNSLCEGQVFGHRAGAGAAAHARMRTATGEPATLAASLDLLGGALARDGDVEALLRIGAPVRASMQQHCLVEKTAAGLGATLELVEASRAEFAERFTMTPATVAAVLSLRNLLDVARLVLTACLNRDETRGAHNRVDHPERDDRRHAHAYVLRQDGDAVALGTFRYE